MPEVKCINKTNRTSSWDRIQYFGGINDNGTRWKIAHADMITAIETNQYGVFYVSRPKGDTVKLVVAVSRFGNKYVKTEPDGDEPNNLLNLPECP